MKEYQASMNPLIDSISTWDEFNHETFEKCFKENFVLLCGYCQFKFGFNEDLSKDVVHNGFLKLWEVRETIKSNLSVKAYLFRIITNISLDKLKHDGIKMKYEKLFLKQVANTASENGFENLELDQLNSDIQMALGELPHQMRRIFELCRYEGMKQADVAEQLNISIRTVETHMRRALLKLRQRLSHYLPILYILLLSVRF